MVPGSDGLEKASHMVVRGLGDEATGRYAVHAEAEARRRVLTAETFTYPCQLVEPEAKPTES